MPFDVELKGLKDIERFAKKYEAASDRAEVLSINKGAQKARTLGSKGIREQVDLKAGYVNERLTVSRKASRNRKSAVVTGRGRATQLIRYATNTATLRKSTKGLSRKRFNRRSAKVRVKAGGKVKAVRAFYVELKGGNEGLAFGQPKTRKIQVLYGPSVDQVFTDVREDISPEVERTVEKEYLRQLDRLTSGL